MDVTVSLHFALPPGADLNKLVGDVLDHFHDTFPQIVNGMTGVEVHGRLTAPQAADMWPR
jgi:hypothetical protein